MWACDGVSVTCPVCSVQEKGKVCVNPLASPQDRFCPTHAYKEFTCFVVSCTSQARRRRLACKAHRAQELRFAERRGKAFRELLRRYRRGGDVPEAGMDEPDGAGDDHCAGNVGLGDDDDSADEDATEGKVQDEVRKWRKRKYTCCEQLVVRPCGMIPGRTTLFGSEGVKAVVVSIQVPL